jgi:uncharacterized membrane protein
MMLENKLKILMYLINAIWLIAVVLIPSAYIIKTGRFLKGFMYCWILYVIMAIIMVVTTFVLLALHPQDEKLILQYFPDGPFIVAIVFLGWIPALPISIIAYGIYRFIQYRKSRKAVIQSSIM